MFHYLIWFYAFGVYGWEIKTDGEAEEGSWSLFTSDDDVY